MAEFPDAPASTNDKQPSRYAFLRRLRRLTMLGGGLLMASPPATEATHAHKQEASSPIPLPPSPAMAIFSLPLAEEVSTASYPPQSFGTTISLDALVASNQSITISDPAGKDALGSKSQPILITYDQSTLCNDAIQIDNEVGVLKVNGVTCIQWPVPKNRTTIDPDNKKKNWMRDEVGPHVHIAPLKSESNEPDLDRIIPATVSAVRAHWLHSNTVYTNADQIKPHLKEPERGARYHKLTPPPGQEQMLTQVNKVDITRLDYRQWAYDNGAKTAYNMLHWQPDQQKFQPQKENLFALNLAMLESSYKDTPGCNPYITNYAGYMGLFQFGMEALGAHKDMVKNKQWQGVEINGDKISNNASFLNNWQSQMAAFQYHAFSLAQQMDKSWREHRKQPHMRGISIVGLMAAAHLRGPGAAKKFAADNVSKGDGTGTQNSYYAKKYGVLNDAHFHHGYDITVTPEGQKWIDDHTVRDEEDIVKAPRAIRGEKQIMPIDNTRVVKEPNASWLEGLLERSAKELQKPAGTRIK